MAIQFRRCVVIRDTLEKATGVSIAQYLENKIWQPFGMTSDGVWQSYELNKHNTGAHGFNATLEDWGKFGLFFAGMESCQMVTNHYRIIG